MTPDALVRTVEEFLSQAHDAVVLEDGAVAFDLAQAKYSISGENNKCLLHLWSSERNVVRRVLDVETRPETLRVTVQRMGMAKPTKLEICPSAIPGQLQPKNTSASPTCAFWSVR